jgi:hypothetical protein
LENCDKINEFQFRQFKQRVKESIKWISISAEKFLTNFKYT